MILYLYLLIVVPLTLFATAAVWVPRPWQWVLLYGGPLVTLLGVNGVPGFDRLGWVAVFGIPWAYLVVLPLLPWRREWVRTVLPVTVLTLVVFIVGISRADVAVTFYLAFPAVAALVGLGGTVLSRRQRRKAASPGRVAD